MAQRLNRCLPHRTYARRAVVQGAILGAFFTIAQMPAAGAERINAALPQSKAEARIIRVGPERTLRSISAAARLARDNDTIEVDAGEYYGDVAVWGQDGVTVRGVGGRVRLIASGASAENKAIWVVRGGSMTVENIEFVGARVPDKNGAGIRFEKGRLIVRNCLFQDNENGILTSNDKNGELAIENSEFGRNGRGDGQSHNLYVGNIRKLQVMGSYFHHGQAGHLLKSRAAESFILYNRLTDEIAGRASYELEFPSGGVAYVIGNIIHQSSQTENTAIVSFGAEGYSWPSNELYLVNNTLANDLRGKGYFLRIRNGVNRVKVFNNLLVGQGLLEKAPHGEYRNNLHIGWGELATIGGLDYRLNARSMLVGRIEDPLEENSFGLTPVREYVHPRKSRVLQSAISVPGALQSLAP